MTGAFFPETIAQKIIQVHICNTRASKEMIKRISEVGTKKLEHAQ